MNALPLRKRPPRRQSHSIKTGWNNRTKGSSKTVGDCKDYEKERLRAYKSKGLALDRYQYPLGSVLIVEDIRGRRAEHVIGGINHHSVQRRVRIAFEQSTITITQYITIPSKANT